MTTTRPGQIAPRSPRAGFARWRVPLGFAAALIVLWLAKPTTSSLVTGLPIALLGQMLRVWAAGHLEKSREVTCSGPYRFTRHPLYLGSTLMGIGLAVACHSLVVALLIVGYLAATLWTAIRTEEAYLRATFGEAYDRYAAGAAARSIEATRRFAWERVLRNKEYRAPAGFVVLSFYLIWRALP